MATTLKQLYPGGSALTITLNSLGSGAARCSLAVDNTTNLYDDVLLGGSFKPGTITASTATVINIYVAALTDGTNYSGGATGTDAAYTVPTYAGDLILIAVIPMQASATIEYIKKVSVANAFNGALPSKYCFIVQNQTGAALDGTAGGTLYIDPIQWQNV